MPVNFNGHFIDDQSYQLIMSLVDIAQAQIAQKGIRREAPSLVHWASETGTPKPVVAVRVALTNSEGALPSLLEQAKQRIEVE